MGRLQGISQKVVAYVERYDWILPFILAYAYLATGIDRPIDPYDEGLVLTGSWLVSLGALPYRDFWTIYAPGQFLATSVLFRIFGPSVLVMRLFDIAMRALICQMLFTFCKQPNTRAVSWATWLVVLLWLERFGRFGYTIIPALALTMLTLLLLRRKETEEAGICAGLAAFFRHDFSVYLCIAAWFGVDRKQYGTFFMRFCAVTGSFFLTILLLVGWQDFYAQLIAFPLFTFSNFMALPFPSPGALLHEQTPAGAALFDLNWSNALVFYSPMLILALCLLAFGRSLFQHRITCVLWVLTLTLLNQARVRSDFAHLFPAFICAIPLLMFCLAKHAGKQTLRSIATLAISLCLIVVLLATPIKSKAAELMSFKIPATLLIRHEADLEFRRLQKLLLGCGKQVFVAQFNNGVPVRGDLSLYFLAQKRPASKYYEPHPGNYDSPTIQQSIIQDLMRRKVGCVIVANPYGETGKKVSNSPISTLLDDYLRDNFTLLKSGHYYKLMQRNDAARLPPLSADDDNPDFYWNMQSATEY